MTPPDGSDKHVVVAAMNDGRLRQFVERFSDTVPGLEAAASRDTGLESPVLVIDLKNRALVNDRESGLGLEVLDSLLDTELWESGGCGDCSAAGQCPILRNVNFLRKEGKTGLQKLTLVSHLSSQRRATLRDFRSAVSYAVTGDIGCAEIHQRIGEGTAPEVDPSLAAWNLVFETPGGEVSSDKLLSDWSRLDPGSAVDPKLVRQFVEKSSDSLDTEYNIESLISSARKQFLEEPVSNDLVTGLHGHYRHLGAFIRFIIDSNDGENLKNRLLLGLSKLTGVRLPHEDGLSVASSRLDPAWTLLKTIPSTEFELEKPSTPDIVESLPAFLKLGHVQLGARLDVSVDLCELLLRAADGEIFSDEDSLPLRKKALSFVERLTQSQVEEATLLSPSGDPYPVVAKDGLVVLERAQ
jgi:hypothetical protein